MSVSHPYLKQLKVHILRFCQHQGPVKDDHPSLLAFFRTLEDIIRDGLKGVTSKFSSDVQRTYWQWMGAVLKKYSTRKLSGPLQLSIEYAKGSKKAIHAVGKGRLVIRCILNKGLLAHCLKLLREDKDFLYLKIEPGDLIDDLFGEPLRQGSIRKALTLMEDFAGSPIYVSVIKAIGRDNNFYRPIFSYLEDAGLCKQALFANRERRLKEWKETGTTQWGGDTPEQELGGRKEAGGDREEQKGENEEMTESGLYKIKFWGFVNVGRVGTVEQIETGVLSVVKRDPEQKREGLLELGETDVTLYCAKNNTVLLQHGYPEISSCGRRVDYPLNFAYIAGETTCTLAKKFTCFVFEGVSDGQSKTILKGIADGFDRTHWAV